MSISDRKYPAISINVNRLSKSFDGTPILRNISFNVQPGEIFVLMGPSGSGKTVLLRHLIGLLTPDQGEISIDGQHPGTPDFFDHIPMAMVFQNGGLLNSLSVEENVGLYLKEHRLKTPAQIKSIVEKELTKLNLTEEDARKYPYELSGGMKKRVAIARAIVNEPKLLLCDEPTGNLDPEMSMEIMKVLEEINQTLGTTIVMATHDKDIVNKMNRRVVILKEGRLVKDVEKGGYDDEAI